MAIPGSKFRAQAIAKFSTRATGINRSPSTRPARAASPAARITPTSCHCGTLAVIFRYSIPGRPWKVKPPTGCCSNPEDARRPARIKSPVETRLAASLSRRETREEHSESSLLHLNHLMIVTIGMDRLIEIRKQLPAVPRHEAHARNFALLERLMRK